MRSNEAAARKNGEGEAPAPFAATPAPQAPGAKHVAWLLCLPLRPGSRVLFLARERGAGPQLLTRLGHVVVAVSPGDKGEELIRKLKKPDAGPGEGSFDAVVLHEGLSGSGLDGSLWPLLLQLTAPDAVIWVGAETGRRKKGSFELNPALPVALGARRLGLRLQALYELYPSYERPFELRTLHDAGDSVVVRDGGTRIGTNLKQTVKSLLPSWLRTICVSPGVGALLSRGARCGEPFVSGLLREAAGGDATLLRLVSGNPDTLILIYSAQGESFVLKLPFSAAALARCEANAKALAGIAAARLPIPAPALVGKGSYRGFSYFVEQKLEGEAVDSADYPVRELVQAVFSRLIRFNRSTARPALLDRELLHELVEPLLSALNDAGDDATRRLISFCARYLERELCGRTIPLVFFHGDLKLENVLVQVRERSVAGVIDWDLSAGCHLPALDLLHLLAYERTVLAGIPVEETVTSWLEQGFDGRSVDFIESYCAALALEQDLLHPLLLVYVLHHLAVRTDPVGIPATAFTRRVNAVLASFSNFDRGASGGGLI